MFTVDNYTPTRVVFGPGRLEELGTCRLPGRKALICVTADGLMKQLGIQDRVCGLLEKNGTEYVIYDKVMPNPTKAGVEEAAALARESGCDFTFGLGGGSSIDTAKAAAILIVNKGDLWDYAYTGSGKKQPVEKAAPIITVSTTCGTGTETDPYCVITKTETNEKLDFAADPLFPTISFIDPELMVSLPRSLTLYQGFDALFHSAECYVTNQHRNRLVDVYAEESVRRVARWLPAAAENGNDLEARTNLSYAANICSGYTQALINTTSHHIIAQTMGGMFPGFPHGATLIVIAEEYYKRVCGFFPEIFDELGEMMGVQRVASEPGMAFVKGLAALMDATGMRDLQMSRFGVTKDVLYEIADRTVNVTGIADVDLYTITVEDIEGILERSYK